MKKTLFLIAALLAAIQGFSQDNRPGGYEATAFKLADFHQNIIVMDGDYTIPSSLKVEVYNNGVKLSDTTDVTIVGDTIKFKLTPAQLAPLVRAPVIYLKDTLATVDPYLLAINVTVKTGYSTPTGTDKQVYIKSMGNIRVSFVGDASTAIYAANRAKLSEQLAIAARDSSNRILDSMSVNYISRLKFGTGPTLRSTTESISAFHLVEGYRSGILYYDPTDLSSADDSVMVIVRSDGKRYKRSASEPVRPELFGANPNDLLDDYAALQRTLNLVTSKGLKIELSEGTYYTSNTLKGKLTGNGAQFQVEIRGKGREKTLITGMSGLAGKNMMEFVASAVGGPRLGSGIVLRDVDFYAKNADRCLYMDYVAGVQLNNVQFFGGEICSVQIGEGTAENYSVYLSGCYFNGNKLNNGQNSGLLRLYHTRYASVFDCVGDGGKYGVELFNSDKARIISCHFEGGKTSALYIRGPGGGQNTIEQNYLAPYGLYDPSAQFDGTSSSILIQGTSGGCAENTIQGNTIIVSAESTFDKPFYSSNVSGTVVPNPTTNIVTGSVSGATGRLMGYNATEGRVILLPISGTFSAGENITQAGTGGVVKLDSVIVVKSYGLRLLGTSGSNIVNGNLITGAGTFGVIAVSDQNSFTNNSIYVTNGMHLTYSYGSVVGNRISSPGGIAIQKDYGSIEFTGNFISGSLVGIAPQADTPVTTTVRNAISPTWPGIPVGLRLFDTTVGKPTYWNGSLWKYIATE